MIFYNVTCNVGADIAQSWITWMQEEHLPEVLATGLFIEHTFSKLLTEAEGNEGHNYCIQYKLQSMEDYQQYIQKFGPTLKQKTAEKWGEQVLAFRSLMEEV